MKLAPTATRIIWKTVVFAGAMLGAPACTKSTAPTPAAPVAEPAPATTEAAALAEPTTPPAQPEVAVVEPAPPAPPVARTEIVVESSPPGATVYLGDDGVPRGKTPVAISLDRGDAELELRLEHDGYATDRRTIKLDADQKIEVKLTKAKRPRATPGVGAGRGFILS